MSAAARCRTCGQLAEFHRRDLCRLYPGAPSAEEAAKARLEQEQRAERIRAAERAVLDAAEAWEDSPTSPSREVALQAAVRALREARKS